MAAFDEPFEDRVPGSRFSVPATNVQIYNKLKKPSKYLSGKSGFVLRFDYTPTIRQQDIDNGVLTRYFGKKANEANGEIIELDDKLYNKLRVSNLYQVVQLPWRITGKIEDTYVNSVRTYTGVVTSNILATLDADKQLKGLIVRLADPLQYYQKE